MRIIFLGTSGFSVPALKSVSKDTVLVLSRPDRPAGRGRKLRKPPAAQAAREMGLELLQPEKLSEVRDAIRAAAPDVMVSASYGGWLPKWLLEAAPFGVVNIHPSLLPLHRGAAPVIRSILRGDRETAVSFMLTDSGWDTGDLIRVFPYPVNERVSAGELENELALLAAEKLPGVLRGYLSGELKPVPQTGEESYAEKITPGESVLNWTLPAPDVFRAVRAFDPVPGARTSLGGRMLKIYGAAPFKASCGNPGEIISASPLVVACGEGALELTSVQPQGKRKMTGEEFVRGYRPQIGDILE